MFVDITVNLIIKAEVKVRGVSDYGLDTKMKLKMQTHDMTGPSIVVKRPSRPVGLVLF